MSKKLKSILDLFDKYRHHNVDIIFRTHNPKIPEGLKWRETFPEPTKWTGYKDSPLILDDYRNLLDSKKKK